MSDGTQALVDAVKAHAAQNYERDGWDIIVECYEDHEIAREIVGCSTARSAIRRMASIARARSDYRADIQGTAF